MTENLLPSLTENEYETLMTCLVTVEGNSGNLEVSTEDYKDIGELISKLHNRTIKRQTYTRSEGC